MSISDNINSIGAKTREESPRHITGLGDVTVGTTQVKINLTGNTIETRIRADGSNTGTIFIGNTGILSNGSNDFIRLNANDEVIIKFDYTEDSLYMISDVVAQKVNIGAII